MDWSEGEKLLSADYNFIERNRAIKLVLDPRRRPNFKKLGREIWYQRLGEDCLISST